MRTDSAGPATSARDGHSASRVARLVATVFGIGYIKPGPGTWGSLAATLLWGGVAFTLHPAPLVLATGTVAASLVALAIGIPAASLVEGESGGTDPQHVVIDEVAGQWLALAAPAFAGRVDWGHALLAFGLFRLFDITKPPPARQLERLHGGLGIMLDDMAAGVFACACGLVIAHWW